MLARTPPKSRHYTRRARNAAIAVVSMLAASCGESLTESDRIVRIDIVPSGAAIVDSRDTVFTARAELASGALLDAERITWSVEDPSIATVDGDGRVTGVRPGATRVAASAVGKSAVASILVVPPPVASVRVTPSTGGVTIGQSLTLRALALLVTGDSTTERSVKWTSDKPSVAVVNAGGIVQGIAAGSVTVTAEIEGVRGTALVNVTPVPVASVRVLPAPVTLMVTRTQQLSAETLASDSTVLKGRTVTWSSTAPTVATVSTTGLVTAITPGTTTIRATSEGRVGTSVVTVILVPVASVTVLPASATLLVGSTLKLTAAALDSTGAVLSGRRITWSSLTPTIATVDTTGLVSTLAPGTARVRATSEGKTATATLTVTVPPVARVTIAPASVTVNRGSTVKLTATAYDAAGNVLAGRVFTWLSGSASIATVDATGLVRGVNAGSVLVFATAEGVRGQSAVTVR